MLKNINFYNGTNHDVVIYSSNDIIIGRDGRYYLNNTNAQPIMVIPQQIPLNARKSLRPISVNERDSVPFFQEELDFSTLDVPRWDYTNFDVIIVSRIYATHACKALCYNTDFLDRLFTPEPLYIDSSKVGSVGLVKFLQPKHPLAYREGLRTGVHPSVAAIQCCVQTLCPCDENSKLALIELQQYLESMGGDY